MMATRTEASAWIGSLAAYNGGRLIGAWIDLDGRDADGIREAAKAAMLEQREDWPEGLTEADCFEELWVFDHEGIGGLVNGECGITSAVEAAAVMAEVEDYEAEAFAAYCANLGPSNIDRSTVVEDFREAYNGEWDDEEDFARNLMDDLGELDQESTLARYFDYAAFARDLFMSDYYSVRDSRGVMYVFRNV